MLDMGFFPQVRQINHHLNLQGRQNLFFSATWPTEVECLASEICQNQPVKIKIGIGEAFTLNTNITQTVEFVNEIDKRKKLLNLFKDINNICKILVFVIDPPKYEKNIFFCLWNCLFHGVIRALSAKTLQNFHLQKILDYNF